MGTVLKGTWKKKDYSFIHELDDGVKGYIAGLIDGEGAIRICKDYSKKVFKLKLLVQISNANPDVIYWLKDTLGGHVQERKQPKGYNGPMYRYIVNHVLALEIIRAVFPWLIIKKFKAELAIEFMNNRFEDHSKLKKYHQRMALLNSLKSRPIHLGERRIF